MYIAHIQVPKLGLEYQFGHVKRCKGKNVKLFPFQIEYFVYYRHKLNKDKRVINVLLNSIP